MIKTRRRTESNLVQLIPKTTWCISITAISYSQRSWSNNVWQQMASVYCGELERYIGPSLNYLYYANYFCVLPYRLSCCMGLVAWFK